MNWFDWMAFLVLSMGAATWTLSWLKWIDASEAKVAANNFRITAEQLNAIAQQAWRDVVEERELSNTAHSNAVTERNNAFAARKHAEELKWGAELMVREAEAIRESLRAHMDSMADALEEIEKRLSPRRKGTKK